MTGRGIGLQAIGIADTHARTSPPHGKAAVFMRAAQVCAAFSKTAHAAAQYVTAQTMPGPYVHVARTGGIWAQRHILHIKTDRKDRTTMHTHIHGNIEARSGEPVEIAFNVTDKDGNAIDMTTAMAEYRLARRVGDMALLTCSSGENGGITAEDNIVTVKFDTAILTQSGQPLLGDFYGQLRITLEGRMLVVAEGPVSIAPVILPAP